VSSCPSEKRFCGLSRCDRRGPHCCAAGGVCRHPRVGGGQGSGACRNPRSAAALSPTAGSSAPPVGETPVTSAGAQPDPAVSDKRLVEWRAWAGEFGAGAYEGGSTPAELPDAPDPTDPATSRPSCVSGFRSTLADSAGAGSVATPRRGGRKRWRRRRHSGHRGPETRSPRRLPPRHRR